MAHGLLLDACREQQGVLDRQLTPPPSPPADWAEDGYTLLAAHLGLLERLAEVGAPVAGLVVRASELRGRLREAGPPPPGVDADALDRRVVRLLDETIGRPELVPLEEVFRPGNALGIDEAFAQIAGMTRDEWVAHVAARRRPAAAG